MPPLTAIDRIEVVRGPMSSLYGSDAMGGVINIITRKAQGEWHASVRTDATITERKDSGNTGQGSFFAAGPLVDNLLSMKVNGQYSHRGEDNFANGFNRQIMTSGGGTLTLTPDEQNSIDFDFKKIISIVIPVSGKVLLRAVKKAASVSMRCRNMRLPMTVTMTGAA